MNTGDYLRMSLKLLDVSVISKLRSGIAITSLAQCVCELVDNSIDAGGSCVAVRVDITKFKVQVIDNGKGIDRNDLNIIGDRYVTSKCHTLEDLNHNLQHLGYRGEALASIINVSGLVDISSRHHLSQHTFSKIFRHGEAVGIVAPANQRPSVGTTVTVHDIFHNMPVRRKTMSDVLELEQIRKTVETIALVNPSISFSVRNDVTGLCILQTHKTLSVLTNFGLLFASGRVGGMKEVSIQQSGFKVSGFISTETHHSKSLQFIYVNKRIVKRTPLHACVNKVLNNSLLTKRLSQQRNECKWKDEHQNKEWTNPRRNLDKYPVYVLMIECPRSEYDVCLEPAKTLVEFKCWDGVLTTLTVLARKFLELNNLGLGITPASNSTQELQDCKLSSQEFIAEVEPSTVDLEGHSSFLPPLQSRVVKRPRVKENTVPTLKQPQAFEDRESVSKDVFVGTIATPIVLDIKTAEDHCSHKYSASERLCLSCDSNEHTQSTSIDSNIQPKINTTPSITTYQRPCHSRTPSLTRHNPTSCQVSSYSCPTQSTPSSSYLIQEPNSLFIVPYNSPTMSSTPCSITTSLHSVTDDVLLAHNKSVVSSSSPLTVQTAPPQSYFTVSSRLAKLLENRKHVSSQLSQASSISPLSISRVTSQGVFNPIHHSTPIEIEGYTSKPDTLQSVTEPSLLSSPPSTTTGGLYSASFSQLANGPKYNSDIVHTRVCSSRDIQDLHSAVEQNVTTLSVPPNDSDVAVSSAVRDKGSTVNPIACNTTCTDSNDMVECVTTKHSLTSSQVDAHSVCDLDTSASCKPVWKEVNDPVSGRRIFVHSVTGNCSYSNPVGSSVADTPSTSNLSISDTRGYSDSVTGERSSSPANTWTFTSSLGMKPLNGACHLSHDYQSFLPRPKNQRTTPSELDTSEHRVAELVSEHRLTPASDTCKWRDSRELDGLSLTLGKIGRTFETLLEEWENPTFQAGQEDVTDIGYGRGGTSQVKVHNVINRYKFTKEMFDNLLVLGQVDNKFIACLMNNKTKNGACNKLLVMVDQHAAHERVRLEALKDDVFDPTTKKVKMSNIHPSLVLPLRPSEIQLAKHFRQQLVKIGVTISVDDRERLLVSTLPSVLMEREVSEVKRGRPAVAVNILQEMVVNHLELLQVTGGGCTTLPSAITQVLNSQACHGAIKFGDRLTLLECKSLIQSLSKCRLPFQCAHGRPSLVPILDLDILERRYPSHQVMPFPSLCRLLSSNEHQHC